LLTQQIGTVFNPLIQNTNNNHQMLATQMGWIADFSTTHNVPNHQIQQVANHPPIPYVQNVQMPNEGNIAIQGQQQHPKV
jgi:hypothetical protein